MTVVLPQPLVEYALRRVVGDRTPAFLLVSKSGELLEWGGDLAAYGVTGLQHGVPIESKAPFLAGALSISPEPVVLPCVAIRGGLPADVHIVPGDDVEWVLLLDASASMRYQVIGQQSANELALVREAYEKLRAHLSTSTRDVDPA